MKYILSEGYIQFTLLTFSSEYQLRVYTILLGDFGSGLGLERFKSGFSVFLLVLYSFLVTVVLLNVLIAIASDR